MNFKSFLREKKENYSHREIPFEHNPKVGWWDDEHKDHVIVYHGTHKRNMHDIYKHGITHKDPTSGMISVALEPHTAHGYASMSAAGGEHHFRYSGGKARNTPHEDRTVFKLKIPKKWIHQHKDPNFHGNLGHSHKRLTDKSEYERMSKEPDHADHHYYAMSELRLNHSIPKEFIIGHMHKVKK